MSVDCWSFRKASQRVEELPVIQGSSGFREFASLGGSSGSDTLRLPSKLLIHGKATFRRTNSQVSGLLLQPIQTLLLDLRIPHEPLDAAWFSLARDDADTATICVLATVDAPLDVFATGDAPPRNDALVLPPHVISWRVNPAGCSFDIHMAWLTAIPLDSLRHREG